MGLVQVRDADSELLKMLIWEAPELGLGRLGLLWLQPHDQVFNGKYLLGVQKLLVNLGIGADFQWNKIDLWTVSSFPSFSNFSEDFQPRDRLSHQGRLGKAFLLPWTDDGWRRRTFFIDGRWKKDVGLKNLSGQLTFLMLNFQKNKFGIYIWCQNCDL